MALDLGLSTRQMLSALYDVALASRTHAQRLNDTLARGLNRSADAAARRGRPAHRRPYIAARTGLEGCWALALRRTCPRTGPRCPWTAPTSPWTATCPCAATSPTLGGCAITYGAS